MRLLRKFKGKIERKKEIMKGKAVVDILIMTRTTDIWLVRSTNQTSGQAHHATKGMHLIVMTNNLLDQIFGLRCQATWPIISLLPKKCSLEKTLKLTYKREMRNTGNCRCPEMIRNDNLLKF